MIVLFNVKITNIRMGYPYTRARWMPEAVRFDVFRYCLASHAVLDPVVDKYVFCITMAEELANRQDELEDYIYDIFPKDKIDLTWARNDTGKDWRKTCDRVLSDPNQLVWLAANDDHIFIDRNLDMVESAISTLNADPDPNAVVYYSHWPEQMRMAYYLGGQPTADGNWIKYQWENFDGIMILKAGRLSKYWDRDYGAALMFKPDYLGAHHGYSCPGTVYAPTREMVRHYEGYSHVGSGCDNIAPPLFIPPEFFQANMKIRMGYVDRDDSATNFNPGYDWLYNQAPGGTDYRWVEEDIPLFWMDRIVEINTCDDYDAEQMAQARDAAFLAATRVPMKCFNIQFTHENAAPAEWFSKQMMAK